MRRERLLERFSDEQLAQFYALPHPAVGVPDHDVRIAVTVALARTLTPSTVADLSCGDAAIAKRIAATRTILGDLAPGYEITGPIEDTIHQLPVVDLLVCTETVEHLDDPDSLLKVARAKTSGLVMSTPVDCFHDTNPQHYHAWDREAVEHMLSQAGFGVLTYAELDFTPLGPHHYRFGIWLCR